MQRAHTMKTSLMQCGINEAVNCKLTKAYATGAFEIQVLLPFMMNPPSVASAVVSMPAGSDPWLGSVKPYYSSL